ncbi:MAG: hypothetical protein HY696_01995 [Deltaproteobacteria bacterium]|nr:hypothetical protein [Deltaproteobacteria bacterium]
MVVDDLAPRVFAPMLYRHRERIREDLAIVQHGLEQETPDPALFPAYARSKLCQSAAYFAGHADPVTRRSMVERFGTPWQHVPQNEIAAIAEACTSYCDAYAQHVGRPEALEDYLYTAISNDDVPALIKRRTRQWLDCMYALFPKFARFRFAVLNRRSTDTWKNLVTCSTGQFSLWVNTHPQHTYTMGFIEFLALHEVCGHMVHFAQLQNNAALAARAPHLLCIAIHTQDTYLVEGIAQWVAALLVDRYAPTGAAVRVAAKQMELFFAARHHILCDFIDDAIDLDTAVDRHHRFLGRWLTGSPADTATWYTTIRNDAISCAQILAYHGAFSQLQPARNLHDDALTDFGTRLLNGFYRPQDLRALVAEYCE